MKFFCETCKGHHNKKYGICPIYSKFSVKSIEFNKQEFFGSSPPGVFIGSKLRYPNVNMGALSPIEDHEETWIYNDPLYWVEKKFSIEQIIKLRLNLLNSRTLTNVKSIRSPNKYVDQMQELGMSYKPVDMEVKLKKKPNFKIKLDKIQMPMGSSANFDKFKLTDNVKIKRKVDKVSSDTDLKSSEALNYLYKNDFNELFLSQLLSVGSLGIKKNRILVPTRWSITATDDTLGKNIIKEIQNYNSIDSFQYFEGNYLGNYYHILLFPDIWNYELFEGYLPGSSWNPTSQIKFSTDQESYYGRKTYANETAGGYYAARLPILNYLQKIRKQASILAIRIETPSYYAALGVWVVRESTKKTMKNKPLIFNDKESMLKYAQKRILENFKYDINNLYKKSNLINQLRKQKKLWDFTQ